MATWTAPSVEDFKAFFNRDFNYAPEKDPTNQDYICDSDITKAIVQAQINFSTKMFKDNSQTTMVFMYLAAFFLASNLQLSAKGISSQAKFPITALSVGGVSITNTLPERFTKNPAFAMYTQNGYGMQYLLFVYPYTVGNVRLAPGTTSFQ